MPARYDITSNQGETLHLHILYTDSDDNGIDLTSYDAEMKVKRTFLGDSSTLLHLTGSTSGATATIVSYT